MCKVWIVDDDQSIRWVLQQAIVDAGMDAREFDSGYTLLEALANEQPDVLVSDVRMPGIDGMAVLKSVQENHPKLPVIIMTAHSDLDSAVTAYEGGAFEYLPKPFDLDEAITLINRAAEHRLAIAEPELAAVDVQKVSAIVGEAPAMQEVFRAIGRLSNSSINVLITGESGTGKELAARALHDHSPRVNGPFIAINTAAIPKDLLESELFGHEKGAFTGAQTQRRGRFEQADNGSLFLDEIGDMPADLQTRLLRVLATGEFYRVGGHSPVRVNVRIIAATHQDLAERVADKQFREDLFHRLNVIRVHMPALRERQQDVPILLRHFLQSAAKELNVEQKSLTPAVEQFLSKLSWPGNVRQLENLCRWLTVMGAGRELHLADLPTELHADTVTNPATDAVVTGDWAEQLALWAAEHLKQSQEPLMDVLLPKVEALAIVATMAATDGHKQEAARRMGWGRNTLTRKIQQLGLNY